MKRKALPSTYTPLESIQAALHHPQNPIGDQNSVPSTDTASNSTPLLLGSEAKNSFSRPSPQYVRWGIAWREPLFMTLLALLGITLALGHHFYFVSLAGTLAGSETRQQWALRLGTAFSFAVVACLQVASSQAYDQYIWTVLCRKSFSLGTLDKLFGLRSNPLKIFSLELLLQSRFVILLALIYWCIPLAGLTPPATLSVVPGPHETSNLTSFITFDWEKFPHTDDLPIPTPEMTEIASATAQGLTIVPITPPASNSSFELQFYGPSIQCSPANYSVSQIFDAYSNILWNHSEIVTQNLLPALSQEIDLATTLNNLTIIHVLNPTMLFFSAFAPYIGFHNIMPVTPPVGLPPEFYLSYQPWSNDTTIPTIWSLLVQQLWVKTTNESLLCLLGNASYNVNFQFLNGIQSEVRYSTSNFEPLWMNALGFAPTSKDQGIRLSASILAYTSLFTAFYNLLSGNVTAGLATSAGSGNYTMEIVEGSSNILSSGLVACDEFTKSYWVDNPILRGQLPNQTDEVGEVVAWNNFSNTLADGGPNNRTLTSNLFKDPALMCRNRTLARAIEDLAGNITIGMLSFPKLTTPNATMINVTYSNIINIYKYDSRNLIISYSIAIFVTIFALLLGFHAFIDNGVVHSTDFSALMATTRNSALDVLSEGHSLGSLPLDKGIEKVRLRFGVLKGTEEEGGGVPRIGFGLEDDVVRLRKGEKYI